jgi:hypothetical protein
MRVLALFTANLLAPLAWLVFLEVEYALVPWACRHGHPRHPLLFVVAALAFLLATASALLGWHEWRLAGRRRGDEPPPGGRAAFMALTGLGTSLIFTLLILSASAPFVILTPCE